MKTDTDSRASAAAPSGCALRVHRAGKDHVKTPRKLLVVDANKVILKTISSKLKECGYEVFTAEDGGSAIKLARELQPHLILLELYFPPDVAHGGGISWDGLLILNWLRRMNEVMEKVPVIVITGGDVQKYKDRCMEAGVLDIFLKPIDLEALMAAIRWALDEEVAQQDAARTDASSQPAAERSVLERAARILFVDDANDWRDRGAAYLGERGYEVATAEDPINAMLQLSQFKPDLVVLDLNPGDQSAVVLLKVLSQLRPELPILVHTATDLDKAAVLELLKQGAWNWLPKGSQEELVTAVERTISGPKLTVSQSAAATAEPETPAGAGSPIYATTEEPEALPALDGLRTGSTKELLSAVERASSLTPEPTPAVPEARGVVPDEVIQPAAESILIVDDDTAVAETLRSFLESLSFRVSEVTTGAEAVSLIAAADVDLILFDLTLPDLRVEQFYDSLKQVKPHLCSRIIFMSSDDSHAADDGFVRRLKGISLWKPFPTDWLLEAVQTIRAATQKDCLAAK
jgi:CheY-like chemotaxis protein